ncbi:hypothetical protein SAMN02745163_01409 [Clostridium cavendishii DSM 21758]|uniref:Uncharacterized protein n=1 Tax=Clostridium cavendishii DSM 21758 TaxID=1121302 RepID=A0A1M6GWE6_9CLOT|nr:hypothetical protein [Clostridium cavendishii]SHJ14261.1 hypothetical protein SAMN02745163_01409 [Clostridium cavendishii DSM 21758]
MSILESIDYDEFGFFCLSTRSRAELSCTPVKIGIILYFIEAIKYYGNSSFKASDIKSIFKILKLETPSGNSIINPSENKIKEMLDKYILDSKKDKVFHIKVDLTKKEDEYIINSIEDSIYGEILFYEQEIKRAYKENEIEEYVEYASKKEMVCTKNTKTR